MAVCAYCPKSSEQFPFTDEHVIPQALGGGTQPSNPLKLPDAVCSRCNNLCGLFIDRPYVLFHMTQLVRASVLREFTPVVDEDRAVLQCMGVLTEAAVDDLTCDFYFTRNDDRVYHLHEEWDEGRMPPVVGPPGPNISAKENYAYIYLRKGEVKEILASLRACKSQLANPEIVLVNHTGTLAPGTRHPRAEDERFLAILQRLGADHAFRPRIGLTNDHRFMCKMALGLGHLFLNDSFEGSPDAHTLKQALWTIDDNERHRLWPGVHSEYRTGPMLSLARIKGCHTIHLIPSDSGIWASVTMYGAHEMGALISSNRRLLPEQFREGMSLVISHPLRRCVGPLPFPHFIEWANGHGHPDIEQLINDMEARRAIGT